ncbi:hypothetical protein QUG02_26535 [Bacillus hominis]|uniref:Uncharacterized protein n=1 Tax=Bacillus hominis TaxID=2817478 RepID=A0ABT7RF99_9BACI|nr:MULTISPECIES: hypothetical protein [Bacillus]MBY0600457.1 hypothetical protein [Bacillus bingmayongensis]MDM5191210.1 hypothetical protein [Bacillus hominis]MDM5436452.1 hypothetical protein [Bacillus hominis]MDM5441609.1 hypothetical protein [Bacillus hominis]
MKDIYELLNLVIDDQEVSVDYLEVTESEKIKVKNELKKILMDNNDSN